MIDERKGCSKRVAEERQGCSKRVTDERQGCSKRVAEERTRRRRDRGVAGERQGSVGKTALQ